MREINEISQTIKKIRKSKNITLKTLSEKTDLSISFLSQVERGVSSLTITSLKKIADALEVNLGSLLSYESSNNYVFRKENPIYLRMQKDYKSHQIVSGKFDERMMEGIIFTIEVGSRLESFSHEGEEFHYIMKGKALFKIEETAYELTEGEIIHFPSTLDHSINNIGKEELKILSVLTPPLF